MCIRDRWLGVPRLTDSRLSGVKGALSGASACCQWPTMLSSAGTYCVDWVDPYNVDPNATDADVEMATAATRTCAAFAGYWWITRYQVYILVVAAMQSLLQSRHNLKAARKAARWIEARRAKAEDGGDAEAIAAGSATAATATATATAAAAAAALPSTPEQTLGKTLSLIHI